jgi:type II secretion system protein N
MAEKTPKSSRLRTGLLYGAFALVAFAFFLVVTFPYDTLRRRIVTEAAAQGWAVRMASLRPGLYGMTATQVRLSQPSEPLSPEMVAALVRGGTGPLPGGEALGEALLLDSVAVRWALFPPGIALRAQGLNGVIRGSYGGLGSSQRVRLELDGLDATQGNLKGFSGLDLEGKLNGHLDLTLPRTGKTAEPDLAQADGELVLDSSALVVRGGNVTLPMGGRPTPMDVPRVALGDVKGRIKFVKGLGTLENVSTRSPDLELRASGTVKLGKRLPYSEPALELKVRAQPEFTRRLGILGSGLSILPPDRESPDFRVARVTGFLSRPNFMPGAAPPAGARGGGGAGTSTGAGVSPLGAGTRPTQ